MNLAPRMRNATCFVAASFALMPLHAASFGETVIVQSWFDRNCYTYYTPVSTPIIVSAPARLFASATLSGASHPQDMYVLVASNDGTVLGVTIDSTSVSPTLDPLSTQGILHEGTTPLDTTAPPLALAPGSYMLQIRYTAASFCTSGESIRLLTLSYVLLSSAFDRIFADGFA